MNESVEKGKPLWAMTPAEFRRTALEGKREELRTAGVFQCQCCREIKDRKDAEDAHIWQPRPGPLAELPMKGVPIYVLCLACKDKDPDFIYYQVGQGFIEAGLFGGEPTEEGKRLLGLA